VAASEPMQVLVADCGAEAVLVSEDAQRELALCERAFHLALGEQVPSVQWLSRSDCVSASRFVADTARRCDLILTDAAPSMFFDPQGVSVGDLLMHAGRPLLITPPAARPLLFQHALLAWDDSRECRRAASDALPLLRDCTQVSVARLTSRDGEAATAVQLNEVTVWLASHGITASPLVLHVNGDARQIVRIAEEHACDLIVAGGYGHSRAREWALGGTTRELLSQQHFCVLMAH